MAPAVPSSWPLGFGIERWEASGYAYSANILEHAYAPEPIHRFCPDSPAVCPGGLCPPISCGRVPFRWFGGRVPASHEHAKSWLGHLLQQEVDRGRLQYVEHLLLPGQSSSASSRSQKQAWRRSKACSTGRSSQVEEDQHRFPPIVDVARPLADDGKFACLWHVWPTPEGASRSFSSQWMVRRGSLPVEVFFTVSPTKGLHISLTCESEDSRVRVYRVLRQYCNDDTTPCMPVPEPLVPAPPKDFSNSSARFADKVKKAKGSASQSTSWVEETLDGILNAQKRVLKALELGEQGVQTGLRSQRLFDLVADLAAAFEAGERTRISVPRAWLDRAAAVVDRLVQLTLAPPAIFSEKALQAQEAPDAPAALLEQAAAERQALAEQVLQLVRRLLIHGLRTPTAYVELQRLAGDNTRAPPGSSAAQPPRRPDAGR
eukprot:TRINITY_DN64687_c0_g1_i1.p1 TRINITY_DN64687_c0_g1~~TRINITY_DN64687_c0_g1_i1.p1  ORF type:complete len:456 (-),score=54.74 TRINITY_DN64687_c0_g1_i1:20-1312(-)